MKIEVNTKEDSHDDIRRAIKMLQHIVGDSQEVFTNQIAASSESAQNAFASMFSDTSAATNANTSSEQAPVASLPSADSVSKDSKQELSESTSDIFAELFSEEEIKKMDTKPQEEEEEVEVKSKAKKYSMEFY